MGPKPWPWWRAGRAPASLTKAAAESLGLGNKARDWREREEQVRGQGRKPTCWGPPYWLIRRWIRKNIHKGGGGESESQREVSGTDCRCDCCKIDVLAIWTKSPNWWKDASLYIYILNAPPHARRIFFFFNIARAGSWTWALIPCKIDVLAIWTKSPNRWKESRLYIYILNNCLPMRKTISHMRNKLHAIVSVLSQTYLSLTKFIWDIYQHLECQMSIW